MITDIIVHGESYDISVEIQDSEGVPVVMDENWLAACRFTAHKVGGDITTEPTMVIDDGVATTTIDTGDPEWEAITYFYDIRVTDELGDDYWTEPVRLTLTKRNTPST
jgi:hypothetical protein